MGEYTLNPDIMLTKPDNICGNRKIWKGSNTMYNSVDTNLNFVDREKKTLEFWNEQDIFRKSMEQRKEGIRWYIDYYNNRRQHQG